MHKHAPLIVGIAVSLTAIIGVFTFIQNRDKHKLETEIGELTKQIKTLELHDKLEHQI